MSAVTTTSRAEGSITTPGRRGLGHEEDGAAEPPALLSVGFLNELLDHLAPVAVLAAMRRPDGAVEDFVWRFANHAACAALGFDGDVLIHSTLRRTAEVVDVRSDTDAVLDAFRRVVDTGVDSSVHLPWPADSAPFGAPVRVHRLGDGVLLEWAAVLEDGTPIGRRRGGRTGTDWTTPHPDHPLDVVLDGVADGIVHIGDDRRVRFSNRRVAEILATARGVEPGRHVDDLDLPGPFMSRWERALQGAIDGGERVVFDHTAPGDIARHVELAVSPVTTGSRSAGTVTTIRDVTDHVRREQNLVSLARRDPLTGLDNRSEVTHELERALAVSARTGRPVALLSVDLDGFKFVNDAFGHHVGDELLQAAADRLRTVVRGGDLLSRTGGDEFVVVCRDLRRADDALRSAWRIVDAFRTPFPIRDAEVVTTASVGVAVSSGNDSVHDVIEQADAAVYAAKAAGRDTVATFDSVLQSEVDRHHQIEVDLRSATGGGGVDVGGQLDLWFQPAYRLATGEITGAEALLRWRHPSGDVWDAGAFVDVAEDTGLLADQSARILELACVSAAGWPAAPSGDRLSVQVNLSPRQLADHGLLHRIDDALRTSGLDPGLLCIEVAETSLSRTSRAIGPNLDGLADRGVSLAFDNFGSGYASLTQLQDFPVDIVKLDRSCTKAVVHSERARNVAAGTIAAAERLGLGAIADGVETERQAAVLARLGYRYAQGFAFSPAVPAADLTHLIRS